MFLSKTEYCNPVIDFSIKWFEQKEIMKLYGREEFSKALCDKYIPERPDMLAVGAREGEHIIAKLFWQLGMDVLPEYQGLGIGTSLSNLYSWNIAFYPAWVEIEAMGEK